MFAYNILGDRAPLPYEQLFEFRGSLYGFVAVRLCDYAGHARPISPKWDTLAMPAADFRRLARRRWRSCWGWEGRGIREWGVGTGGVARREERGEKSGVH